MIWLVLISEPSAENFDDKMPEQGPELNINPDLLNEGTTIELQKPHSFPKVVTQLSSPSVSSCVGRLDSPEQDR